MSNSRYYVSYILKIILNKKIRSQHVLTQQLLVIVYRFMVVRTPIDIIIKTNSSQSWILNKVFKNI